MDIFCFGHGSLTLTFSTTAQTFTNSSTLPQHNWQQPRRDLVLGYYGCSRIRETRRMFICHYHVQRVEVTRAGGGCSLGLTIPGTISNFNISRGPGLTSRTLLPYHLTSTASHMINMIWLDISVQELVNLWYLNMNIISLSYFIYFRLSRQRLCFRMANSKH